MGNVDLSNAPILDAHTHPYRLDELLARDPDGFDTRIMFLGEAFLSSSWHLLRQGDSGFLTAKQRTHTLWL